MFKTFLLHLTVRICIYLRINQAHIYSLTWRARCTNLSRETKINQRAMASYRRACLRPHVRLCEAVRFIYFLKGQGAIRSLARTRPYFDHFYSNFQRVTCLLYKTVQQLFVLESSPWNFCDSRGQILSMLRADASDSAQSTD